MIAGEGEGLMALEKDPVKYMAVLLGMDSAENRDEMARQVLPLLDADLPLSQQLATLDEVHRIDTTHPLISVITAVFFSSRYFQTP